jgi:hypothetical protein
MCGKRGSQTDVQWATAEPRRSTDLIRLISRALRVRPAETRLNICVRTGARVILSSLFDIYHTSLWLLFVHGNEQPTTASLSQRRKIE